MCELCAGEVCSEVTGLNSVGETRERVPFSKRELHCLDWTNNIHGSISLGLPEVPVAS